MTIGPEPAAKKLAMDPAVSPSDEYTPPLVMPHGCR